MRREVADSMWGFGNLLIDLLLTFSGWMYAVVLELFGYDTDWDPIHPRTQRRGRIASALICFFVSAALGVGLIWLVAVIWRLT